MKTTRLVSLAIGLLLLLGALLLIGQQASALSSSVSYGDAEGPMALAGSPVPVNVAQNRLAYCSSIENTCSCVGMRWMATRPPDGVVSSRTHNGSKWTSAGRLASIG